MQQRTSRVFEGDRLYLRPFTVEDSELLYAALFDEEVRRLTGTQHITSKSMTDKYIERVMEDSERVQLMIVLKEGDRVIGELALIDIDSVNRNAHLRIALFYEEDCNKGYGSEAIKLLLEHGFGVMNLHRIELSVFSYNARAIKAYEKLGFVEEGRHRETLYYNHAYHDSIMMSILEDEYRAKYVQHV